MADPLNAGTNFYPQRGDPLGLPSAWVRDTTDTNVWRHKQQASGSSPNGPFPLPSASIIVLVQNNSGANRQQGEILGIDGLVLDPPTSTPTDPQTSSFFYNPVLAGIVPTISTSFGLFVVCVDSIAAGAFGRACISGLCAAWVNMANINDDFADITDNDSTQLLSGGGGSGQIIYSPGSTGKQLCLILMGPRMATVNVEFGTVDATTPGKYAGTFLTGNATGMPPTGLNVGSACTIFNYPDHDLTANTQAVPSGSPAPGLLIGQSGGKWYVQTYITAPENCS